MFAVLLALFFAVLLALLLMLTGSPGRKDSRRP